MKIYVTHSSGFDYQKELYHPLSQSELNTQHQITLPHKTKTEPFNSKEYLKECDLVVAEVSYPSTGQGIELGWANLYKIPIVCFYKKGTNPSGSLKVISNVFVEYSNGGNLVEKLTNYLSTVQTK